MSAAKRLPPPPARSKPVPLPRVSAELANARVTRLRAFFLVWTLTDNTGELAQLAVMVRRAGGRSSYVHRVVKGARSGFRRAAADLLAALAAFDSADALVAELQGPPLASDYPADTEIDPALTLRVARSLAKGVVLPGRAFARG